VATIIIKWLVVAGSVSLVGWLFPGVHVENFWTALLAAAVFGLMNVTIGPVLRFLTLPITILTLGIFSVILNTLLFWSVTAVVPGFSIDGFWWAMLAVLGVSAVSTVGNRLLLGRDGKFGGE
jgi:putative membrane protein